MEKNLLSVFFALTLFFLNPFSGFGQCNPSVSISSSDADNTICAGTEVIFTAVPSDGGNNHMYQWRVNGVNVGSNSPLNFTFTTTTLQTGYVVSVALTPECDPGNTVLSNSIATTVNPIPTVSITNPSAVCSPSTANLTAAAVTAGSTAGLSYTYWTDAGATSSYATPSAAGAGTYFIKGTTAAGCFDIKPVTVTVNPPPTVLITNPLAVCSPATVNLTAAAVTAGSTGGLTFTYWTNAGATSSYGTPSTAGAGTYYIKGTTAIGCFDIKPVTVTVNPLPTITGTTPGSRCGTGTVGLSSTASAGTINWYATLTGGASLGAGTTFTTPSISSTTTYYVDATYNGCTTTARTSITATVNTIPSPIAGSNSPICAGGTINLTASAIAGAIYSWTGPNSFTSTSQNPTISNATAVMAGTYSVTATVSGCTSNQGTTNVVVNAIPSTPTAGSNSPVCAGGTINLTASTIAGASYSWTGPNSFTSSSQNPSISNATAAMVGTYSVKASVSGCTSNAGTTNVVVNAIPSTPTAGSNSPVCAGATINLTASTIAGASYSWTGPNSFTSTSQNPSISNATAAMAGAYNVTATVAGCKSSAGTTSVTINPTVTPSVTITSTSTAICSSSGIPVTFTAIPVNGGASPSYQWRRNGTNISGATSSTYTPNLLADPSTISVVMTSNAICPSPATATSNNIIMTVFSGNPSNWTGNPVITLPLSVCPPGTIDLSVPVVANAEYYQWSLPSGFTITSGANTRAITVLVGTGATIGNNQSVTVQAFNPCGSNGSKTEKINVNSFNGVTVAQNTQNVCYGGSISLIGTLTGNAATAIWSAPSGAFSNIVTSGTNPITVSATYTPSITNGNVTLTITTNTPIGGGCPNVPGTATVAVTVNQPSVASTSLSASTTICNGSSTTLTQIGGSLGTGASWKWYSNNTYTTLVGTGIGATANLIVSPTATTTYYLRAESSTGAPCAANVPATGSVTVTVNQQSIAPTSISASTSTICNGDNITLTQTGGSIGTGASWKWYSDAGFTTLVGTNTTANASLSVNPSTTTTYYLRAESTTGAPCAANVPAIGSVTVTVNQPSVAPANISASNTTICNGDNTTLTHNGGSLGTGASWKWYTDNTYTTLVGTETGSPLGLSVSPIITTTYYLRAESVSGAPCAANVAAAGSVIVTVNQPSVAPTSLSASTTICNGDNTTLTQTGGSLGTGASWKWYTDNTYTTLVGTGTGATASLLVSPIITTTYYLRAESATGAPCVANFKALGSVTVTVNQPSVAPTSVSASTPTICNGDNTTLTQTGGSLGTGASWKWYSDAGFTALVGTNITADASLSVNPSTTTTYYLRAESTSGSPCTANVAAATNFTITVNQPVVITAQPASQKVCSGFPVSFSVTATGTGLTYQWRKGMTPLSNGGNISGVNSATLTISNTATSDAATNYNVVISGAAKCTEVISDSAVLIVNQDIDITTQPIDQIICEGNSTSLSVAATGSGLTYQWRKGGIPISGATTLTLTITNAGSYDVVISGTGGTCPQTISNPATLKVNPNSTMSLSSAAGTDAQTKCISTAITSITYAIGGGGTGASITAGALPTGVIGTYSGGIFTIIGTPSDAGTFNYTVTTSGPCSNVSLSGSITVNGLSTINLSSAAGTNVQTKCISTAITPITYAIGGGGTGASITAGALPTGVTGTYSGGIFTISGTPSVAGTFNYTVTTSGPCSNVSLSGSITVTGLSTINLSSAAGTDAQTKCISTAITPITYAIGGGGTGASITAGALPTGVTGTYSSGIFTISGTPSVAGTFNYTVTTSGPCSNVSLSGSITVNGLSTINLSSAAGTNVQTKCISTAITPITYAIGGGGTGASITAGALPTGITGTYSGGIFTISGTPLVAGTFNYTITTSGPCSNVSLSGSITVNGLSTINLSSAAGTNLQTKCISTAITPITYAIGGGGTGASITAGALPTGVTGTYSGGVFTISGTPSVAGTFNYTVTTTGPCSNISLSGSINIDRIPIGGELNFPGAFGNTYALCDNAIPGSPGSNPTITLSNYTGTIKDWQMSSNAGVTWTSVQASPYTATTYNGYSNLSSTTLFRAIIENGVCGPVYSKWAVINIIPSNIKPAPVSASPKVLCFGESVTLSSQTGYGSSTLLNDKGDFNNANSMTNNGWRVRNYPSTGDLNFPANGDDLRPRQWSNTNDQPFYVNNVRTGIAGSERIDSKELKFGIVSGPNPSTLETPIFNTLGLDNFILNYFQAYNLVTVNDKIQVQISTDGGNTYPTVIQEVTGIANSDALDRFGISTDPRNKISIDLSNYVGQSNLRIRFLYMGTTDGSIWAIDGISLPSKPLYISMEWRDNTAADPGVLIGTTETVTWTPKFIGVNIFEVTTFILKDDAGNRCTTEGNSETVTVFVFDKYTSTATSAGTCGAINVQLHGVISSIKQGQPITTFPTLDGYTASWTAVGPSGYIFLRHIFSPSVDDPNAIFTPGFSGNYTLTWTMIPTAKDEAGSLIINPGCPPIYNPVTFDIEDCTTLDFDGVDDYVDLGTGYTGTYSIEAWIRPESSTGTIISGPTFEIKMADLPSTVTPNTRWYHVAVSGGKLYIDGIQIGNAGSGSGGSITLIGARWNSTSGEPENYFSGWIEEVRIWNKTITQDQIRFMMNQHLKNAGNMGVEIPMPVPGGLLYSDLEGYYRLISKVPDPSAPSALVTFPATLKPLNGFTPDLAVTAVPGRLVNMTTNQENTAPLPYISAKDDQLWATDDTWIRPDVWDAPNSKGIDNTTPIDWNIVRINHNINSGDRDITVLGLKSETAGKLLNITHSGDQEDYTNPGQMLRVTHYLLLNGNIDLVGESQLLQDEGSVLDDLSAGYLERDQQGKRNSFVYNYWSSPVSPQGPGVNNAPYSVKSVLMDGTTASSPKDNIIFNSAYWAADFGITSPITISTYWLWGYSPAPANIYAEWDHILENGPLKTGEGFTMKGTDGTASIDDEQNYTFRGKPHNGDITLKMGPNQNYLIGNPYPSAIDADQLILDYGTAANPVFDGSIYFWDHFYIVDHILKEYIGGYAVYNLTGGIKGATSSDARINDNMWTSGKTPARYIPVAQGFLVNSSNPVSAIGYGGDIIFKNSYRVFEKEANGNSIFLKPEVAAQKENKSNQSKKIRLSFSSPVGYHRQILVGAIPSTTNGFDLGYDALLFDDNVEDMYWLQGDNQLVIQGVPNFDKGQVLPLGVKIKENKEFRIRIDTLENTPAEMNVYLNDKLKDSIHDLKAGPYVSTSEPGYIHDRFEIIFFKEEPPVIEGPIVGEPGEEGPIIEVPETDFTTLSVTHAYNLREIQILNPDKLIISSVYLFDLNGNLIENYTNIPQNKVIKLKVGNYSSGVYLLKVYAEGKIITKKIIISN